MDPTSFTAVLCLSLSLLSVYAFVIYPAFVSPLAKVPNAHWSAPYCSLWIIWIRYKRRANRTLNAAHLKHGPLIRLGPGEVAVNTIDEGVKVVYNGSFEKPTWYSFFANYGLPPMFATLTTKAHGDRRRLLSNAYAKNTIIGSDAHKRHASEILHRRMLPLLADASRSERPVDVFQLWSGTAMDFITAWQFGLNASTNYIQDPAACAQYIDWYQGRRPHNFWAQDMRFVSQWVHRIFRYRLVPLWVQNANVELEADCLSHIQSANQQWRELGTDYLKDATVFPALSKALGTATNAGPRSKGDIEKAELMVASEMMDHLGAGHETTGITMTYLTWELSRRPEMQQRLRDEIAHLDLYLPVINKDTKPRLPDLKHLGDLPFLNSIIMETVRLHNAVAGSQPRLAPAQGCTLVGRRIPGGTQVSAQAYSLHRNEEAFPDPEQWNPDRWIGEKADLELQNKWFWGFSSGGKMCVGSNFAMNEMKLILSHVYSNFQTAVSDDEGIDQPDGYSTGPRSGRLMLSFERIEKHTAFFTLNTGRVISPELREAMQRSQRSDEEVTII